MTVYSIVLHDSIKGFRSVSTNTNKQTLTNKGLNHIISIYRIVFRQVTADIKRKKYKIKTSFVRPEELKARANKTGLNFIIFILIFMENCL